MTRIAEGYLARPYQGVKGGRDAALLDIAQDHALHLLHNTVQITSQTLIFGPPTPARPGFQNQAIASAAGPIC